MSKNKRKGIKEWIASDLKRYGVSDVHQLSFFSKKELFGFWYMKCLRLAKYHKDCCHHLRFAYYRYKLFRLSQKYGFQIPYTTQIDKGFYLGHMGGIIVNADAKIGKNVNLAQGVTIGADNRGDRKGAPTIGNDVWIGANCVVVGNITIGDDVMICPNTFVNMDVPSHSIVISATCAIKPRDFATHKYIENRVE